MHLLDWLCKSEWTSKVFCHCCHYVQRSSGLRIQTAPDSRHEFFSSGGFTEIFGLGSTG